MKRLLSFLLAATGLAIGLQAKELLEIKGDYLLYSYDFNAIYGLGSIQLRSKNWSIQAGMVEVDVTGRVAQASRGCRVQVGKKKYAADLLEIDLQSLALKFTSFKESIRSWTLAGTPAAAKEKGGPAKKSPRQDLEGLKKSLVYWLNRRIVITPSFRVYGYESTVFIEGVQSLSFRKFKLDQGDDETSIQGAGIDKISFSPTHGVVVDSHLTLEKTLGTGAVKTANSLDLRYDILGSSDVPPRFKVYFNSVSSLDLGKKSSLNLNAGTITGNMSSAMLAWRNRWAPGWTSEWAIEYTRTEARREELWLRFRSNLQDKLLGNVALNLAYEKKDQYQADVSLQNQALKNVTLSLEHSRSRLLFGQDATNRLSSTGMSLAYTHRLFQMAADYQFHKDLLLDQSQGTPRFTLNAAPFRLYHGLLQMNFTSGFMVNQLNLAGKRSDQSRANLALSLKSETVRLGGGPAFDFSLAAEQLLDQERVNRFTSLGGVFKCSQSIAAFADLDLLYNFNTRRQTEAWLIQGGTSQDWSAVLRLKQNIKPVQGWLSVSYDTKTGSFTSGYLDCAVTFFKNWQLQTQMNYDFMFKNFNYDLYLIRNAGRIMLRASYRSLSRKFFVEILPR